MSSTNGSHPVWDRELDCFPVPEGGPDSSTPLKDSGNRSNGALIAARAIAGGIILPIVCLTLDPCVFKRGIDEHGPLLGNYRNFFYSFIVLQMCTLALWLVWKRRLQPCAGFFSGMFLTGAFVAGGIGLIILPLSLIGMLLIIGVLGLTPWFTAYVFYREGTSALRMSRSRSGGGRLPSSLLLGAILAIGLPASIYAGIHRAWQTAIRDVSDGDMAAIANIAFWYDYVDPGGLGFPLDRAIDNEPDPARKRRLLEASWTVTVCSIGLMSHGL